MERKSLESAAASYSYLRGLLGIPLGLLLVLAALGNWEWGPFRHTWLFVGTGLAIGLACLAIVRYYQEHYGRVTPSTRHQVRGTGAVVIGLAIMGAVTLLARSEASWSLDRRSTPSQPGSAPSCWSTTPSPSG